VNAIIISGEKGRWKILDASDLRQIAEGTGVEELWSAVRRWYAEADKQGNE